MVYDNIIWPFLTMDNKTRTKGYGYALYLKTTISNSFIIPVYEQSLSSENTNQTLSVLRFGRKYLIQFVQQILIGEENATLKLLNGFIRFPITHFIKKRQLF